MKQLIISMMAIFLCMNHSQSQKLYGFMNIKEEIVIPAKFEKIGAFTNGLAPAQLKGKWGYINIKGDFIVEPKYLYAEPFQYGFAKVSMQEQTGFTVENYLYINSKGEEIPEGKILKEPVFMCGLKPNTVNGKYGFINTKGEQQIAAAYDYASPFNAGGIAIIKKGEAYGCINKTGKVIVPCNNLSPIAVGDMGYVTIANNDQCTIYDSTGAFTIVPKVNEIYSFDRSTITTFKAGDKYGYINTKGKIVVPAEYDEAGDCKEGLAKVKRNKQLFVLEVATNKILSYVGEGNDFYSFTNGKTITVQNKKYGMVDKNNNVIIANKYEWLSSAGNDSLIGFAINYMPPPAPIAKKEQAVASSSNNNTTTTTAQTNPPSQPTQSTVYRSGNFSSSTYALDIFSELGSMALYVGSTMYVVKIKGKTMGNQATVAARAAQVAGVKSSYKYQWFPDKNCMTLKNQYSSAFTIYCNGEIDLNK